MELKKNFYLTILILSTIISFAQAQELFLSNNNLECGFLFRNSDNNLDNFPFQFGLEYGTTVKFKDKPFFINGYWFSAGLSLYAKRIFLRSEFGTLKLNSELGDNASYFFLGFSGVPFAFKQHKISLSFGLSRYSGKSTFGLAFGASANYIYSIYKFFSLTAGFKMPVFKKSSYDEFYHNPMLTFGIQIF
jgi:hypothetical protein